MAATVSQCVVRLDDDGKSPRSFDGRCCLGWVLREFLRFGVTDFLLLNHEVPATIGAGLPGRVRVSHCPGRPGSGSGGALLSVGDQLQDRFLLYDSSALFDWNFANLVSDAAADEPEVIGRTVRFDDVTNGAIGLFRRQLVDHLRPDCDLGDDVLPDLAQRGLLRVTLGQGHVGGRAPRYGPRVEPRDVVARLRRRALFLDRDGVLNIDHGYVGTRERFEWVRGALDAIRHATETGWHVFVVTNQSGIARGLYTENAVRELLGWMADEARAAGGTIDDARFCPFHPEATLEPYRQAHPWRKPLPGMLLDLIRVWELDPARAIMVGDQSSDMQAAAAANITGHLFRGGNLFDFLRPILDRSA